MPCNYSLVLKIIYGELQNNISAQRFIYKGRQPCIFQTSNDNKCVVKKIYVQPSIQLHWSMYRSQGHITHICLHTIQLSRSLFSSAVGIT